jgi:hypothetical protein
MGWKNEAERTFEMRGLQALDESVFDCSGNGTLHRRQARHETLQNKHAQTKRQANDNLMIAIKRQLLWCRLYSSLPPASASNANSSLPPQHHQDKSGTECRLVLGLFCYVADIGLGLNSEHKNSN